MTKLKNELEERFGTELTYYLVCWRYLLREFLRAVSKASAMFWRVPVSEVTNIVDEPTAAAAFRPVKITDGAVVDVGGRHNRYQHPERSKSYSHR